MAKDEIVLINVPLEEYKTLVTENAIYKTVISKFKAKVLEETRKNVNEDKIEALPTKGDVLKWMAAEDNKIVEEFTKYGSWEREAISENSYKLVSIEEVTNYHLEYIKLLLKKRLEALNDAN